MRKKKYFKFKTRNGIKTIKQLIQQKQQNICRLHRFKSDCDNKNDFSEFFIMLKSIQSQD